MHTSSFTLAALVAVAATAPASITLRSDDVVLYGQGHYQIMKRSLLNELEELRKNGTVPPIPGYLNDELFSSPGNETAPSNETATTPPTNTSDTHISKRWSSSTLIVPNPRSRFLGWDIQMSEVVKGAPTQVTVGSGHDVSNSISVGTSASFSLVKEFLEASVSVDYSSSWTSSQSQQFAAEVPAGKYGAFVSNPWTNRESGNVFEGVIGSEGSLTYYQGDSFDSKSFGQLAWVDGVISLCVGDAFPLPRCLGEGTL
jgi:hypothetical protein